MSGMTTKLSLSKEERDGYVGLQHHLRHQPHDNFHDTVKMATTRRNHDAAAAAAATARRYLRNVSGCCDSTNGILNTV